VRRRRKGLLWKHRPAAKSLSPRLPEELYRFFFRGQEPSDHIASIEGIYNVDAIRKAKLHGTNRYLALRSLSAPGTFAALEINYPGTKPFPPEGKFDYDLDIATGFLCASGSYWPLLMVDEDRRDTRLSYIARGVDDETHLRMVSMVDGDPKRTFAFSAPLSFASNTKPKNSLQTLPVSQLLKVTDVALYQSLSKKIDNIINRMYNEA